MYFKCILLCLITVNGGPKPLTGEEVSILRRQLQEIRNRVVHLLDNLETSTLSSSTNGVNGQATGVTGKQVSTSAASSVSAQRGEKDFGLVSAQPVKETSVGQQQAGPVDTGMLLHMPYLVLL